jgi:exodeoxyribonuclease VIII
MNKGYKQPKQTSALARGTAFHTLLLEPDSFEERIKVKAGVQSSKVPGFVGEGELEGMRAAVAQIHAMPTVSRLFTEGETEVTMVWKDKETGALCRCRHDYFRQAHGMTVDYKTIAEVSEREIDRAIVRYGYYIQAAFYLDGMKALGLGDHQDFVFVFQQSSFPYKVYATTICDQTIERGREAYKLALRTYATMMERYGEEFEWPAYPDRVHCRQMDDISMHAPAINYGFMPVI